MHLSDWNVPSDPTSSSPGAARRLLSLAQALRLLETNAASLCVWLKGLCSGATWVFKSSRPLVFEGPFCCPRRMDWSFVLGEEEGPWRGRGSGQRPPTSETPVSEGFREGLCKVLQKVGWERGNWRGEGPL